MNLSRCEKALNGCTLATADSHHEDWHREQADVPVTVFTEQTKWLSGSITSSSATPMLQLLLMPTWNIAGEKYVVFCFLVLHFLFH